MAISESLPISEPLAVPLQLEAQVRRDPEFSGVPDPIHHPGEMLGVLG